MRELSTIEIQYITGAAGPCPCNVDPHLWNVAQNQAIKDGIFFSGFATLLATSFIYGIAANPVVPVVAGLFIAPSLAILGYFNSHAWDAVNINKVVPK